MVKFCSDADILRFEPALFGELHLPFQILANGSGGVLSGVIFTVGGADFVGAAVQAGGVIALCSDDGSLDGVFEVVSVDSATQLTVSVVRSDDEADAVSPGDAADVSWRISTLEPQIAQVGYDLTRFFRIGPGDAESDYSADDIAEPAVLRQVSVVGAAGTAYKMISGLGGDTELWEKGIGYLRQYAERRSRCVVSIDSGGDGSVETRRFGGDMRMSRG